MVSVLADVLDHATSEMALGRKLGLDATKKLPGEGFRSRPVGTAHEDGGSGDGEAGKVFRSVVISHCHEHE